MAYWPYEKAGTDVIPLQTAQDSTAGNKSQTVEYFKWINIMNEWLNEWNDETMNECYYNNNNNNRNNYTSGIKKTQERWSFWDTHMSHLLVLLAYIQQHTEKTKCHICCSHNHLSLTFLCIFLWFIKMGGERKRQTERHTDRQTQR